MLNERIRLLKSEEELLEMPENIIDIYKTGIIEKHTDRPTIGRTLAFQNFFLVEFAASYYKKLLMLKMTSSQLIYQNLLIGQKISQGGQKLYEPGI